MNLWLGFGDDFIHPLRSWDPLAHDTLKHHERLGNFKRVILFIIWCLPWGPQQRWEGRYSSRHRRRETEEVAGALLVECFFHFHKSMFLRVCIIHHSQMFGIAGSNQLISWVAATLWTKPTDPTLLVFWVFCAQRQALQEKQKQQQKKTCSQFLDGYFEACCSNKTCFCQTLGEYNAFCLLTVVFAVELWLQPHPEEKAARTEGPGCTKALGHPSPPALLRYLWRFGDLGAGCLSLSGPRLSRPRLLKRNDESRRPKGSSLLRNEL